MTPIDKGVVTRRLPTLVPQAKLFKPKVEGKQKRSWKGIKLVTTDEEYIQDIQLFHRTCSHKLEKFTSIEKGLEKSLDKLDTKEKKPADNKADIALSCYPEKEPKRYFLIEQRAKKKGINPLDFIKLHREFEKKGLVINVKGEKWIRSQRG